MFVRKLRLGTSPALVLPELVFPQNRRGGHGREAEEGAQWGLASGLIMRVWQDKASMLFKREAENRDQRSQEGSWGGEIQS